MAQIIDGKELAKTIRLNLKEKADELKKRGITPKLAVIMVGDDKASKIYVRNKSRACEEIGIEYEEYILNSNICEESNDTLQNNKEKFHNYYNINSKFIFSQFGYNLLIS